MNIWNIFLTVVIIGQKKAFSYLYSSRNLVCFSQSKGDETKNCDQSRGFKTCFTRYNSDGKVTGRGCSTKRAGYVACETHSYGPDTSDKFCYCSKPLCNAARGAGVGSPLVLASCILIITMALSSWPGLALGIQDSAQRRKRRRRMISMTAQQAASQDF